MKKIFIIGAFGYTNNQLDGQTIKTRNVFDLIKAKHDGIVSYIDTLDVRRKPWILFPMLWKMVTCNKLVLIPCTNNLNVLFPIAYYMSRFFGFDIIHICIGGWQVEYFIGSKLLKMSDNYKSYGQRLTNKNKPRWTPHPLQMKLNKRIKVIMPEMKTEIKELENLGFSNLDFFPNFRMVNSTWKNASPNNSDVLKLIFMARIMKLKGYETVFTFAEFAKEQGMKVQIDFYGQINPDEESYFMSLVKSHSDNVNYCGYLVPDKITSTLMEYDMMMLPTRFYTESLPGTILDSYIAGIPIIATKWKYAEEFIEDGKTGFIVPFKDGQDEFNKKLKTIYEDRDKLTAMKENAAKEAIKYSEDTAWNRLKKYLYD